MKTSHTTRLARKVTPFLSPPTPASHLPFLYPPLLLTRSISLRDLNPFRRKDRKILDPLDPDFGKRSPSASRPLKAYDQQKQQQLQAQPQTGDLAPGSILDDAIPTPKPPSRDAPTGAAGPKPRDPATMAAALDPDPKSRIAWQRRQLIRSIRNSLVPPTKRQILIRTERESLSKSPLIKTSVKKLMPLARQIAGKPIEEAIVQMRYSTKKAAGDVRRHLEFARDEAVVRRGMGLGAAGRRIEEREGRGLALDEEAEGEEGDENNGENLEDERDLELDRKGRRNDGRMMGEEKKGWYVVDRKGKKKWVEDQTDMYVDQAWVTKGPYEDGVLHRARGRIDRLKKPWTGISILLKEEKTRMRLMGEREEKRQRQKVWVQMPNRPVTAQRQYNLW